MQIGIKALMEFLFNCLPSMRVPGGVYGWYRSDLSPAYHHACHGRSQNTGGKTGLLGGGTMPFRGLFVKDKFQVQIESILRSPLISMCVHLLLTLTTY